MAILGRLAALGVAVFAFRVPPALALELLRIELRAIMQQVGAPSIRDLKPTMVRRAKANNRAM